MLGVVEGMARRLLTEEEVAAVMNTCRRVRSFVHAKIHLQVFNFWFSHEGVFVFTVFISQFH